MLMAGVHEQMTHSVMSLKSQLRVWIVNTPMSLVVTACKTIVLEMDIAPYGSSTFCFFNSFFLLRRLYIMLIILNPKPSTLRP